MEQLKLRVDEQQIIDLALVGLRFRTEGVPYIPGPLVVGGDVVLGTGNP